MIQLHFVSKTSERLYNNNDDNNGDYDDELLMSSSESYYILFSTYVGNQNHSTGDAVQHTQLLPTKGMSALKDILDRQQVYSRTVLD
jgi:hypothetical protein